jgi:phosphatidylglycerol:prolipoprotein diacylglycerol transferase
MTRDFGVQLPPMDPGTVVAVHPTQLYEVAMGLVMFGILWKLRKHRHREGWLFGGYLVLAGIERFIIEFFRAKDDRLGIGLTTAQAIAIVAFAAGIAILFLRRGTRESVAA